MEVAAHTYRIPTVRDYGTILRMSGGTGFLVPGLAATTAQMSTPLSPGTSPTGGDLNPSSTGDTSPTATTPSSPDGSGVLGNQGSGTGLDPSGGTPGSTGSGTAPVSVGSGTGGDNTGSDGGSLPFTGFPAGLVAAVGAGLTAVGASISRALRRNY